MNVFHLLTGIAIAKSKENQYHVTDTQSLQNTALLSGLLPNPLIGYLLIDKKAKELATTPVELNTSAALTESNSNTIPVTLPASGTETEIKNCKEVIKEVCEEMIKKINPNFLASKNEEINKQIEKIRRSYDQYHKCSEIERLKKLQSEFEDISKSVHLKVSKVPGSLTQEEIDSFKKIEKLIREEKLIEEYIKLLEQLDASEAYPVNLMLLSLTIFPEIKNLHYKIKNLEQFPDDVSTSTKSEIQPDDASSGTKKG